MKKFKNLALAISLVFISITFFAFVAPQDQKTGGSWEVPAKYKAMKNPSADDASTLKIGKMLYTKHCRSCHGNQGLGDGSKSAQLNTFPGDFTSEKFKKQPDGEKYFKAYVGRDEMPNFEKKIVDEEDRWAVINYLNSLK